MQNCIDILRKMEISVALVKKTKKKLTCFYFQLSFDVSLWTEVSEK